MDNIPLIENEDYYFNALGLMVLTRAYLLKRGYCCQNGCLHCPYGLHENSLTNQKKDLPS